MTQLDTQLQDQINRTASRYYWQARLLKGHLVPTRELSQLALQAIENFHSAGHELPRTEMTAFVEAAEAWLERNRGKIWRIAAEEESG